MNFIKPLQEVDGGMLLRAGVLGIGVCVPKEWTDEQISAWANSHYTCGTTGGWHVRKEEQSDLVTKKKSGTSCLRRKSR